MDKKTVYWILGLLAGAYVLKAFSRTVGVTQGVLNDVESGVQDAWNNIYQGITGNQTSNSLQQQSNIDNAIYPWLTNANVGQNGLPAPSLDDAYTYYTQNGQTYQYGAYPGDTGMP